MNQLPWWSSLAIVWVATLLVIGLLWSRFTRAPELLVPGVRTRRVVPVWLALLLLIILVVAIVLTVHFGNAARWGGRAA